MADFLAMGGYAAYVWPAYGIVILVMGGLWWQSWRAAARRDEEAAELRARLRGGPARRPARPLVARREPAAGEPQRQQGS